MSELIKDIAVILIILLLVIIFVVIGIRNTAKIKKGSSKKSESVKKEEVVSEKSKMTIEEDRKGTSAFFNDPDLMKGNYLHERFNQGVHPTDNFYFRDGKIYETNERRDQELSEKETAETLRKLKEKRTRDFYDYNPSLDTTSGIIFDIDSKDYDAFASDYDIDTGIDNQDDIAGELKNMSSAMKGITISNILDKKD